MLIETMEIRKVSTLKIRSIVELLKMGWELRVVKLGLCCSDRFMVNVDLHTVTAYFSIMYLATYIRLSS